MARESFQQELDQLRLQVEVMAAQVGIALSRMHEVLRTGDAELAAEAIAADDLVDAMLVSLTERTYDLLRREAPVASDLRYLVSVLRVLEELERVGDISLRVVKQAPDQPLLAAHARLFEILDRMAVLAESLFRTAVDAWSAEDAMVVGDMAARSAGMDDEYRALLDEILALQGPGAVAVAVTAVLVGRALERIADHTVIVGERVRYLLTGDPAYLASEVR
ncbi:MAG: phosphate transport system protein [Acidimicrobiaceae bacterium]